MRRANTDRPRVLTTGGSGVFGSDYCDDGDSDNNDDMPETLAPPAYDGRKETKNKETIRTGKKTR